MSYPMYLVYWGTLVPLDFDFLLIIFHNWSWIPSSCEDSHHNLEYEISCTSSITRTMFCNSLFPVWTPRLYKIRVNVVKAKQCQTSNYVVRFSRYLLFNVRWIQIMHKKQIESVVCCSLLKCKVQPNVNFSVHVSVAQWAPSRVPFGADNQLWAYGCLEGADSTIIKFPRFFVSIIYTGLRGYHCLSECNGSRSS